MSSLIERALQNSNPLKKTVQKVVEGERLSRDDALALYASPDLLLLARLSELSRARKAGKGKEKYVYYNHNMHLNPTDFCVQSCRFCSYSNPSNKSYTWTVDRVIEEAEKGVNAGIREIHMVGGLNPACDVNFYEEVFRTIKQRFPHVHLKALTAVEIEYLAELEKLSFKETIERLKRAGLGSMTGGGAEIFDDEIRRNMYVTKTPAPVWLEIHGIAHGLCLKSNATMLTGIGESAANKVNHLLLLREQQDKSKGFQCFIPLKCHYGGTTIAGEVKEPSCEELLKDVAVSRLVLDNFDHIKAYWIQLGEQVAQLAFSFGADDMDGTILEEKITHAAGASTPLQLSREKLETLILQAGYTPVERDTTYNILSVSSATLTEPAPLEHRLKTLSLV